MKKTNSLVQAILLTIALFFILTLLVSFFNTRSIFEKINLNDFKQLITENNIDKLIVFPDKVEVWQKDKIYVLEKDSYVSIYELFKNLNIEPEKYAKLKIEFKTSYNWNVILNILVNILPFLILLWFLWSLSRQAQKGSTQIFSFGKSGIKVYNPNDPNRITFKDVADLDEAKQELMEVVEFLKNPEKFFKIGARIPKGVLLVGAPGTGKTMLAQATASEAGVPFFYISGSEFVEMFVGVGASRVRDAFAIAKKNQPCILFIDELDAIGKIRGIGITGAHEEREQTLNQILVEMDGFEKETKIVVLAATNRPDTLDPALLRPGRFDRKIVLDLPDLKAREEILKIHLKDKKVGKVNLKQIAQRTPGFSGADLANLCNEAAILAARRNKTEISQKELLDAIEKVLLGPERKSKIYSKQEKEIAAYHEAGHAIVAHYLPYANPVEKISIISRGRAGGYTLKLPQEDKSFYFKKEFIDEIASMLGGYVAEKIIFNDTSTGAQEDLRLATDLAYQLVTKFGMSDKIGPIYIEDRVSYFEAKKDISEKTIETIDEEIKRIIDEAKNKAEKIILERKDKLEAVAQALIKKETLEKRQFEKIVKDPKVRRAGFEPATPDL